LGDEVRRMAGWLGLTDIAAPAAWMDRLGL
jgi:hypothetical protein